MTRHFLRLGFLYALFAAFSTKRRLILIGVENSQPKLYPDKASLGSLLLLVSTGMYVMVPVYKFVIMAGTN